MNYRVCSRLPTYEDRLRPVATVMARRRFWLWLLLVGYGMLVLWL